MTFIITLIALVVERFFDWSHLRQWRWYNGYQAFLDHRIGGKSSYIFLLIAILPPVFLVGIISYMSGGFLSGGFKLVFGLVVLLYCLGPANFWAQAFSRIADFHKDDPNIALQNLNKDFGIGVVSDSQTLHLSFTRGILLAGYYRIFAVVFWLAVLGPMGAVLYRMVYLCVSNANAATSSSALRLRQMLDWIPVRIFTFLFALGGHFTEVFNRWKALAKKGIDANEELITDCGMAALNVMKDGSIPENSNAEKEAIALLDRVFIITLFVLAVVVVLT